MVRKSALNNNLGHSTGGKCSNCKEIAMVIINRRIIAAVTVGAVIVLLSGCASNADDPPTTSESVITTESHGPSQTEIQGVGKVGVQGR